jgi:hypothetical protein
MVVPYGIFIPGRPFMRPEVQKAQCSSPCITFGSPVTLESPTQAPVHTAFLSNKCSVSLNVSVRTNHVLHLTWVFAGLEAGSMHRQTPDGLTTLLGPACSSSDCASCNLQISQIGCWPCSQDDAKSLGTDHLILPAARHVKNNKAQLALCWCRISRGKGQRNRVI